jgi:methionyl aminopeptidase
MGIQSFGENYHPDKLYLARETARALTYELASEIRPGMTEAEAHQKYKELSIKHRVDKQWHPPKIRFGANTLKNFKDESEPHVLQEEDVFFVDIGPVIEGHEADYGETFAIGSQFDHKHIADSAKKVFHEVGRFWMKERCDGEKLYEFAKIRAAHYGYHLNMGSDGHRIGDFPHHIHFKGGLVELAEQIVPDAWILEIHLWDPKRRFGAFFEDILTDRPLD